jgi:elongation factor G
VKPVVVENNVSDDSLPESLLQAALDELQSCSEGGGPIGSFPLTRIKVAVLGGEWREESSDETAFRIAANDAFDTALRDAGPVLLEPIMRVEVSTPEEYFGDIDHDLQRRRGYIVDQQRRGEMVVLEAEAPLSELFGYSGTVRSLSQGRAGFSMEPLKYAPAPLEIAKSFAF